MGDRETVELRKIVVKLEADLTAAHQSQSSANSAVSKQRLNSDIEMQKLKEENMSLQSRLGNTEYELRQKEELSRDMSTQMVQLRENVKLAQSTADTAEREKRLLGVELEDVRREQATTLKFETLTKTQCMQDEITTLKESLETEKKKNVDTERQLQELQEQHETSQYFSNLYKSQVRENKDEI